MSLSDYSSLEQEIEDAPEPIVLPKGSEVKARIIGVRQGTDKNGFAYFMPVFDVPDQVLVKEFSDFFYDLVDIDKLDEKGRARAVKKFQVFAKAFDIDYSKPFDFENFTGLEGWVILGVTKHDEYGEQNSVSKYVCGS